MREIIARLVCLLAVSLVVSLAHVFAARHNPHAGAASIAPVASVAPSAVINSAAPIAPTPPNQSSALIERTEPNEPPTPTVAVAVATSAATAVSVSPTGQPAGPAPSLEVARGREVYAEQNCSVCHAIAGAGNPRNPLDGVGARRTRAELREWITGTGSATEDLAPSVVRRKQRYQSLPAADLDALVTYLATLTTKP